MYRIMRRINLVSRCQGNYVLERLKPTDLAFSHHSYILAICRCPGISQERLAEELGVNKSNVARTLACLEQNGYVQRKTSQQDKRVLQVFPTEKTQEVLPRIRGALQDWNTYLTADFSEEEMALFDRILDQMVERAQNYREKGVGAEK